MPDDHLNEEEIFHPRIDWALWRKVLVFAKPYRNWLIALGILGMLCGLCDAMLPQITGKLVDLIKSKGTNAPVLKYGFFYVGTIAALATFILLFIIVAGRITTGV